MSQNSGSDRSTGAPCFTNKQGQYLAFIHAYTLVLGRPPAEADTTTSIPRRSAA